MNTLAPPPRLLKTAQLMLHPRTSAHEAEAAGAAFARLARAARLGLDDLFGPPRLEAPRPARPAACDVTMPFGKHTGDPLGEIAENNLSYLRWLLDKATLDDDLEMAVEAVLRFYTTGGDE